MKIPKIEYEVYYPILSSNLEKLNLTICKNTKIDISIPVDIDEDLDIYNSSSGYYNDICYTYNTKDGTDISLSDRKKDFIENNKTLCEENCEFTKYNYDTGKAICSCDIKISIPLISDIYIDKNRLYENFVNIKNIMNIDILKCYSIVFSKEGFYNNYGFFILIPIFILHIITIIIVILKGYNNIKNKIIKIVDARKGIKLVKDKYREYKNKLENILLNIQKNKNFSSNRILNTSELVLNTSKENKKLKVKVYIPKQNNDNINILFNKNIDDSINKKNDKFKFDLIQEYKNYKEILKLNNNELNSLTYIKAIKNDKRTFWNYYFSLLKTNHLIFFSFILSNDYNSRIIKIDLFFINFTINFTVNALFFNDETMNKIYVNKGDFNIVYQIPKILYSSLISIILYTILKLLGLSENIILEVKKIKKIKTLLEKQTKAYKFIKLKWIFFFIISSIMILLFSYYLVCFGAIYKNTQIHLIKSTIISFALSLIYPFFIYLIPGLFRIPSLTSNSKIKELFYKFSKLIQKI